MDIDLLKKRLDKLSKTYDRRFLSSDPIKMVHRYAETADREVVGLLCASLAYGHVKMIQRNLERLLGALGPKPAEYIRRFDPARIPAGLSGFSHRFNKENDIILLLHYMKQMLETHGSVGDFFRVGHNPGNGGMKPSLASFVRRVLALDCSPVYQEGTLPKDAGVRFFFPSPAGGSACKRLNLYLRWMVRRGDGIDFGLWPFVSPAQLVIPLDTHVARICRRLSLTQRKSADWAMAVEITDRLRRLDPDDPVKYDFAISRLGILAECPRKPLAQKCSRCEIRPLCNGSHNSDRSPDTGKERTAYGRLVRINK